MTSRFEGLTVDCADPRRPAASPPRSSSSGCPAAGSARTVCTWTSAPSIEGSPRSWTGCSPLGARFVDVGQGAGRSWHVLADPEGNEFCLVRSLAEGHYDR
ncbi:MAG TPA: VOC family protein [Kineosporiaceae bacterium]|nr:VOC family protein [Kineosporiaceae bacterium]